MLRLLRGVVVEAGAETGEQRLIVDLGSRGLQPAVGDPALIGRCEVGDEVVVNVAARELGLGSGGADIVHVNLSKGLDAAAAPGHVMKLNYSSLQHAVEAVESQDGTELRLPIAAPVAVVALHGQLAPVAFAVAAASPTPLRLGYVQTAGGALPAGRSRVAAELRERGLLASHLAAAPCYGAPDGEAITTIGALYHGFTRLGWDAAVCGPGPGIVGSASALGHGGMAALDSAHAALALGAAALIVPRLSSGDPRPRHQGISHHTKAVLELLLGDVAVAIPEGESSPDWGARHRWISAPVDLDSYAASDLPATTMGRTVAEDPLFFAAALAGGAVLERLLAGAGEVGERRE